MAMTYLSLDGCAEVAETIRKVAAEHRRPDLHLSLVVPTLYRPEVPHEALPENDEEHSTYRIRIDGVTVRYVEDMYVIQVTAEGELPGDIVEQLRADLVQKLETVEQAPIEYRVIPPA